MTSNPTRYRSRFTGKELDEILASIKYKLDETSIANDWLGGYGRVASAELAKILHDDLNSIKDPNFLLQLILDIPGFEVLTPELKEKLASLNTDFRGVFKTVADRNAALVTTNFKGNELTLILDYGGGLAKFESWDSVTKQWHPVELYDTGYVIPTSLNNSNATAVIAFDSKKYRYMKVAIVVSSPTEAMSCEMNVLVNPATKKVDYNFYGINGSNTVMFNVDTIVDGDMIDIMVTGRAGQLVTAKRIAQL